MEFFEWLNTFWSLFDAFFEGVTIAKMWIIIGCSLGIYAICLVFGGLGMKEMAKKEGLKHSWLAFIPFANTYYAGKIAGTSSFFGQKVKRGGLYAMIAEILCLGMNVFSLVMTVLLSPYVTFLSEGDVQQFIYEGYPESMQWMIDGEWIFQLVTMLFYLLQIVFFCVIFTALFRKYFAKNSFIMTLLSAVFPFRGFALFAVRKNTPVDYNDYMRRRAEEYRRQQQGYYPPQGGYGGYPGNQGGYGGNTSTPHSAEPEDPFGGEFGGKHKSAPEDPFAEFSENSNSEHKNNE